MSPRTLKLTTWLILTALLALGFSLSLEALLAQWDPPPAAPPAQNIPEFLNAGPEAQVKTGPLGVQNNFLVGADTLWADYGGGSVGIGTTMPRARLDINDQSTYGASFMIEGSGVNKLTVLKTGRVGIGTENPGRKLEIAGTDAWTGLRLKNAASFNAFDIIHSDGAGSVPLGALSFYSALANTGHRLVITPGGNIGLGVADPKNRLHLQSGSIFYESTGPGREYLNPNNQALFVTAKNMDTTYKYTPAILFGSTDPAFTDPLLGEVWPKAMAGINAYATKAYTSYLDVGMGLAFYTSNLLPQYFGAEEPQWRPSMVLDDNGLLGIGTEAPTARLHAARSLDGSAGGQAAQVSLDSNGTWSGPGTLTHRALYVSANTSANEVSPGTINAFGLDSRAVSTGDITNLRSVYGSATVNDGLAINAMGGHFTVTVGNNGSVNQGYALRANCSDAERCYGAYITANDAGTGWLTPAENYGVYIASANASGANYGLYVANAEYNVLNGRTGINTGLPSVALDVNGAIHATQDICTDLNGGNCLGDTRRIDRGSFWISTPFIIPETHYEQRDFTVSGAGVGDGVVLIPPAAWGNCHGYTAWVAAVNTVRVRFINVYEAADCTVEAGSWSVNIIKN